MNYEYESVEKYNMNKPLYYNEERDEERDEERNEEYNEKHKKKHSKKQNKMRNLNSIYAITHLVISFFAIYLSWRCSGRKFDLVSFIFALFCPHFYIIYALAVNGGCGIFDDPQDNFSNLLMIKR